MFYVPALAVVATVDFDAARAEAEAASAAEDQLEVTDLEERLKPMQPFGSRVGERRMQCGEQHQQQGRAGVGAESQQLLARGGEGPPSCYGAVA